MNTSQDATHARRFEFTGAAKEYFGIWIVNLLLTLVTLGIYSAWAKVRRKRYFYGNTYLDGYNFDYHARPLSILIGRIVVVAAIIVYQILITVSPIAAVIIVPYLFAVPWIINRSLRFNARVTSYRNIRFDFEGSYWKAFLAFIVMPLVAVFSLGTLVPFASRMSARYMGNNLRYGQSAFRTEPPIGALYGNLGTAVALVIAALLVLAGVTAVAFFLATDRSSGIAGLTDLDEANPVAAIGMFLPLLLLYVTIGLAFLFYRTGVRNIVYNATTLTEHHRLRSALGRLEYAWILVSNLFAIVFTLGLLKPWASVRSWGYTVYHTGMESSASMDEFVGASRPEGPAVSAEFVELEGIDLGF